MKMPPPPRRQNYTGKPAPRAAASARPMAMAPSKSMGTGLGNMGSYMKRKLKGSKAAC